MKSTAPRPRVLVLPGVRVRAGEQRALPGEGVLPGVDTLLELEGVHLVGDGHLAQRGRRAWVAGESGSIAWEFEQVGGELDLAGEQGVVGQRLAVGPCILGDTAPDRNPGELVVAGDSTGAGNTVGDIALVYFDWPLASPAWLLDFRPFGLEWQRAETRGIRVSFVASVQVSQQVEAGVGALALRLDAASRPCAHF